MKHKKAYAFIFFGTLLASMGYYFFFLPAHLVIGGVNGISLLLTKYISPSIVIYSFNAVFLVIGYLVLGKRFFQKTVFGALLYPTFILIFELFHINEELIMGEISVENNLLIATTGGLLLTGVGIGLAIKNGGSTGGMDIPQKILSKVFKLPFSWVMYFTDGIIIMFGMLVFGIEKGFFAIVAMLSVGYIIDIVCVGGVSKRALYIITNKEEEIRNTVFSMTKRGLTRIEAYGEYTKEKKSMLICIMKIGDYYRLREAIERIDSEAFVFISKVNEVLGKGFNHIDEE